MTTRDNDLAVYCNELADKGVAASRVLSRTSGQARTDALLRAADRLIAASLGIQEANAKDLAAGEEMGLSSAMLDRLRLDDARIEKMAESVRQIAGQVDPVGEVVEGYNRPNGLRLTKVRTPIGVVLIIYESRPNVTSDAAALCMKSGNAVILRGGKEATYSNAAIADCMRAGLEDAGVDPDAVQLVGTVDRATIPLLLRAEGKIDLCIPRGGKGLIRAVVEHAHVPVIKHEDGICHVYVDDGACDQMAHDICVNAKVQKPSVCNAAETLLFSKAAADRGVLVKVCDTLAGHGVEVRGCEATRALWPNAKPASDEDWRTEYLDLIVSIRVVDSLSGAIEHINTYGSRHTDAIITQDIAAADRFVAEVDTANGFVNCSTRFSDGGEYGLGAEIGISTDKLHARGPMGAADLTTYKWVCHGSGQTRGTL